MNELHKTASEKTDKAGNAVPLEHANRIQELGDMLELVSAKVPKIITECLKTLYSEEAGSQMGKAVGKFYKELVEAGIPDSEALKMTKDYMDTVKSLASNFNKQ